MMALLLTIACGPQGQGPPRRWRGEDVGTYKADLPELDSATAIVCTPPTDDDLIVRLMSTDGGFGVERYPDRRTPFQIGLSLYGVTPVNPLGQLSPSEGPIWGAFDVYFDIVYSGAVANADTALHTEQVYDWGMGWPANPGLYDFYTMATFKGPVAIEGVGSQVKISRSDFWYDQDGPLDEFYPYRTCVARLRPDRFEGAFWFDAMDTRYTGHEVPGPLYALWNSTQSGAYRMEFVEHDFNDPETNDERGPRSVHSFSADYDDGITEAEFFLHLVEEE